MNLALHDFHLEHCARMQPFAGHSMPIHYALGILGEHHHTRSAAGLFDVSHMGQILLRARSGDIVDAARALESLVPVDVVSLPAGRQRYGFFTTQSGGIIDDLMIANLGDRLYLVVNAACADLDLKHLRASLLESCEIECVSGRSLLALQGPAACDALSALVPSAAAMSFMDAGVVSIHGIDCVITRSGYTGEDGFEIPIPDAVLQAVAESLLAHPAVRLVGLGARDNRGDCGVP